MADAFTFARICSRRDAPTITDASSRRRNPGERQAHLHATLANLTSDSADPSPLIEELSASSQEFVRLWDRYDVRPRRSRSKTFQPLTVGKLTLHQEVLHLTDDGLRLTIYQAAPGRIIADRWPFAVDQRRQACLA